ncbi:MAG: PadR family transcriptional regulator [Nocardioidaceae bacterium]|nr:PadR family transcriptional regulator [Nocardioidaceae bacterium]
MAPPVSTFVVLGLLARRPGSGYDVAAFAEKTVRHFWPISRSQLYIELSRLEELGWATGTAVQQDRYPDKRDYETTPAGIAALREWLDESPHRQRQRTQDAVMLKTFLGSYMSPDRLADQLRDYREQAEKLRAELLAVVEHLDAKGPTGPHRFGRATARYGVLQSEATIAWTEEAQTLLDVERGHDAS